MIKNIYPKDDIKIRFLGNHNHTKTQKLKIGGIYTINHIEIVNNKIRLCLEEVLGKFESILFETISK